MYECEVFEYGETIDCKNKAQCLEVMVSEKITKILFSNISHWQGTWHCKDGKCREMLDFQCERWKEKRTVSFHKKHQKVRFSTKKNCFSFFRRCKDIACGQSVLLMAGDSMLFGDCRSVSHLESGETIWTDDDVHSLLVTLMENVMETLVKLCWKYHMDKMDQLTR